MRSAYVRLAAAAIAAFACAGAVPPDSRSPVPDRAQLPRPGAPQGVMALPGGEPSRALQSVWEAPRAYGEILSPDLPEEGAPLALAAPLEDLSVAQLGYSARVHFIDVGQGAATLFEFPCGAVLIDGGAERNAEFDGVAALQDYLAWFFGSERPDLGDTLDLLVVTHPHTDHTKGLATVTSTYTVRNVVTDGLLEKSQSGAQRKLHAHASSKNIPIRKVKRTGAPQRDGVIDPVSCTGVDPEISILWGRVSPNPGWSSSEFQNPNNHSVVVRVKVDGVVFLVTGDLEDLAIADLLQDFQGNAALDVDVYQTGHHGSDNGTTAALVTAMSPQAAVISAGAHDRKIKRMTAFSHGHPREGIVQLLDGEVSRSRAAKAVHVAEGQQKFVPFTVRGAVYSTGWDGSVVIEVSQGQFAVETER